MKKYISIGVFLFAMMVCPNHVVAADKPEVDHEKHMMAQAIEWKEILVRTEQDLGRLYSLDGLSKKDKDEVSKILEQKREHALAKVKELEEAGYSHYIDDGSVRRFIEMNILFWGSTLGVLALIGYFFGRDQVQGAGQPEVENTEEVVEEGS